MQGSNGWVPPSGKLGEILAETRKRVATIYEATSRAAPAGVRARASLKAALRRDAVAVIAEIKRRSPSKGVLNSALDAPTQARAFERGGAAAISVLTEPSYFGGSIDDLIDVSAATALPLLKKDFHIDPVQYVEAVHRQASAILLIARALSPDQLALMMSLGNSSVEKVVEVRTEAELDRALDAGAEIIGVNSRNLETLEIDATVPERLMPKIPRNVIGIWESGVQTPDDVRRAADCGADAVLVGSALSRSADPESLVRSLTGIPRTPRHG